MDKLTYSTDTTAALPSSADLSAPISDHSATGNSTDGYFGGGSSPGGPTSTMDKITYSTDTTAALPSGANLSESRRAMGASSARENALPAAASIFPAPSSPAVRFNDGAGPTSNTGYFGGGYDGPDIYSTMDKVTYSTDTTAAVPGAPLSVARYGVAATGNSTSGYFGGGEPGPLSTMDKVTYSTDTTAEVPGAALSVARRSPGANLSAARYGLAASSARANGLPTSITGPAPVIV